MAIVFRKLLVLILVFFVIPVLGQTTAPTSITGSTTICSGSSTTLTANGGTLGTNAVNVWYQGGYGGDAYDNGWDATTSITESIQSTTNNNNNGILNVTSTGTDAQFYMRSLGSFDPTVYKYINVRYRVTAGTAFQMQIFFLNATYPNANGGAYVNSGALNSDGNWHTISIDMSSAANWTTGGNITGWRFDWSVASGVTMDIDFIQLGSGAILDDAPSITVSPTTNTTYYLNRKGPAVSTSSISQLVTVNALPTTANAGADQTGSATCGLTSLNLAGNTPTVGTGAWSIVSGTGGTVTTPSSATSTFTGTAGSTYTLRWTITNGSCTSTDDVTIRFNLNPGNFGNALNFDGNNDYVPINNSASVQLSTGTIEAWIKTSNAGSAYRAIVVKPYAYGLFLLNNQLVVFDWGSTSPKSTSIDLADNNWHHVAFTFNSGVANGSFIYIDGVLKHQTQYTISNQSYNLEIGNNTPGVSQYFSGSIDEVRVWNVIRTASEIQASMNTELSSSETGLVAYYNFNQGTAGGTNAGLTTLNDGTTNGNSGTLTNMALSGSTSNWVAGNSFSIAAITGTSSICSNATTQMADATLGGIWSFPNSTYASVNSSGLVTGVAAGSPTLTYTLTSGPGCTSAVTQVITVRASPTPTFTSQPGATACSNTDVTYTTESGQSNYVWTVPGTLNTDYTITSGGIGTTSNTVTLKWLTAGSKTVTINYTNSNGCAATTATSSTATTVSAGSIPTFIAQPGATACASTDVTYTTQSSQTNYVWTVPGTLGTDYTITSGGVGSSSNTVTLKWLTAGSKTVTINYTNSNGCTPSTATSSTATTVYESPVFLIQPSASAQSLCAGDGALSVEVDPGSGDMASYKWYSNASALNTGGSLLVNNASTISTNSYAPTATAYYYVEAANSYGCSTSSSISGLVTITPAPTISSQPSSSSQSLCINTAATALSVTAATGSGSIKSYKWYSNTTNSTTGGTLVSTTSTSATTNSYTPLTASTGTLYYYCVITNTNDCSTTSAVSGGITVGSASVGGTATAAATVLASGGTTTLYLTGYTGNIQWQQSADGSSSWTNVIGGSGATTATYTTAALSSTTYYKAVVTSGGCAALSSNTVTVTVSGPSPISNVEILVVGGGGGGSARHGGGGGGGQVKSLSNQTISGNVSITVGAGGAAGVSGTSPSTSIVQPNTLAYGDNSGGHGQNSSFGSLLTAYGGAGGPAAVSSRSGGNAWKSNANPPESPLTNYWIGGSPSWNTNANTGSYTGGGGAGSGGNGGNSSPQGGFGSGSATAGSGGDGTASTITGSSVYYGGGGGGGAASDATAAGSGGIGGGGAGGKGAAGTNGTANTGGGGGGSGFKPDNYVAGSGGSGVVILRYPGAVALASGGTISYITSPSNYVVHTFNSSGTLSLSTPPSGLSLTSTGVITSVCLSASAQTTSLVYTASTGSATSYSIDWNATANTAGLTDQGSTSYTFVAGGGSIASIVVPANIPAGTYAGTMTISNGSSTTTQSVSLAIGSVSGTISGAGSVTSGTNSTTLTLTGYTGTIQWQSSTNNSTFSNIGGATSATYTATNLTTSTFYKAVVTSGACASATSAVATITVAAPSTAFGITGSTTVNTISNNVAAVVDPNIVVTANGTISGFTVSITSDYTDGDVLGYTGALPYGVNVSAFDVTSRSLYFTGSASAADWQTLLRTVTLTSTSNCYPTNRKISFLPSNKYYNYFNGHYYEYVPTALSWTAAKTAAAGRSFYGRKGYLVTISSEAENNFIWKLIAHDSWIGASCLHTEINSALGYNKFSSTTYGQFYWVTGPEKGTSISNGLGGSVTPVTGVYSNWSPGEPNNYKGWGENSGHMFSNNGYWNDYKKEGANNGRHPIPYIVEFGGSAGDDTSATVAFTRDIIITGSPAGTVSGAATVCNGTNSTTLTYSGGGTIQNWEYSTDNFATAGIAVASTSSTLTVTNLSSSRYYRAVVNATGCTGLASSAALIDVAITTSGSITALSGDVCAGGNAALTLNGNSGDIQKWQVSTSADFTTGVTDISNTTNSLSYALSSNGTYYFRASVLNSACVGGTAVFTEGYPVTVTTGTPPVGGTVNSVDYCGGSNAGTLTLSGATGTSYEWEVSTDGGVAYTNAGNTSTTFNYTGITSTTKYRVLVTSGSCGTTISSVGTVAVNTAYVDNTISLSSSAGTNAQTIFLDQPISNIRYVTTGATGASFSGLPSGVSGAWSNDVITISGTPLTYGSSSYTITLTGGCSASTVTATGTIVVNTRVSTAAVLSGTATICNGTSTNLSVAITDGTSPYTVVYSNGTSNTTVTNYTSGANISVSPTATTTYSLVSVSNAYGFAGTGNSGSAVVTVTAPSVAGTISGAGGTCFGTAKTLTLSGNTGTIQWQVSTTSSSSGFSDISGATASTYSVPSNNAVGTYYYQAVVTNGVCSAATTTAVTVNVNELPVIVSQSTATQTVCQNSTAAAFTVTATGTGLTYQWFSNTTPSNGGGTSIALATNSSYTPPTSTAGTTYYYCVVTNSNVCTATSAVSGAVIVNAVPVVAGVAQAGAFGNGLDFDGSNDYVSVSTNTNIPIANTSYTLEAYIKPTTHGTNGIVGWGNWGSGNQVNALRLGSGNQVHNYWWGNDLIITLSSPLNDGSWHHIAATFDGTTRKIYVDGILKGSDNPSGHNVPNANNMRVGTTNNSEYFNGSLDEVKVWNVARTQSQIQASMNSESAGTETGLVAYYNFNQGTAGGINTGVTSLTDRTSNTNNGTLTNFALTGLTSNWVAGANSTGGTSTAGAVCINSTIQLSNATTGGVWSTSDASIATVSSSGLVTGIAVGSVTISYTVTNASNCSTTATTSVTVNALPTPTFTSQAGSIVCASTDVTYTTESGQSSYVWTVPGTLGTDYSITSGGIGSTSNTVTLKWLTSGSKTVSINYSNSNGCTAASATSSSATTVRPIFTTGAIATTGETICYGGTPASTIGSTTASSGGDASITYSWRSSVDGYLAAISGATSATYLPPAGLTTTTSYRRYATDGTCNTTPTVSTGTWTVTVSQIPTTANAGPDQNVTASGGAISVTLAGNTPSVGTGLWTIVSGTGGNITTPTSPTSTFTGTAGVGYVLRWTISNSPCNASSDDITITSTYYWTGSAGDDLWTTGNNWSAGSAPTGRADIVINLGSPRMNTDYSVEGTLTIAGTGVLIVNAGKTLSIPAGGVADFGGKQVTFKSDATGTGQLGIIAGTLNNASNVIVERHIPAGKRAFRFFSSSVTTTGSIRDNWMEGATPAVGNLYPYRTQSVYNPNLGYGTLITGTGGATNGFDASETNNPSLFTFNNSTNAWAEVTSTAGTITAGNAYRLLIRGDRSYNIMANTPPTPTATILRTRGTIVTGTRTSGTHLPALNQSTGGWSLVGNPYQSVVDMSAASVVKTNLTDYYYVWDPRMGTRGAYVAYNYVTNASANVSSAVNRYVQPGQAFFVQSSAAGSAIQFTEAAKGAASNQTATFGKNDGKGNKDGYTIAVTQQRNEVTQTGGFASLSMLLYETDSLTIGGTPADATRVLFAATYSNNVDLKDGRKFTNLDETMAVKQNNTLLSMELRALPDTGTVLPLNITQYRATKYTLRIFWDKLLTDSTKKAYLKDKFTAKEYMIDKGGNYIDLAYTITSDAKSSAADRFEVVFKSSANVVTAVTNWSNGDYIKVYPNPVISLMQVDYKLGMQRELTLKVYDMSGREVLTQKKVKSGDQVNMSRLLRGIYQYQLIEKTGKLLMADKLMKD